MTHQGLPNHDETLIEALECALRELERLRDKLGVKRSA
jgi:hypothetical protein